MTDLLLAGVLWLPFVLVPEKWALNPKIQPWLERCIIIGVALWLVYFEIVANEIVNGG
jgi:hypothetical protein